MVSALTNIWLSFLAGLFAPLGAVCVLPLYPGFLAYLSNQLSAKDDKKVFIKIGLVVTLGILISMFIVGLVFTAIFKSSLTNAIGVISPIAFGILGIVSLLMIFNVDFARLIPQIRAPMKKNPYWSSFLFGFFFGAIVLPCNPASLTVLFALSSSTADFALNSLNFTLFGIGMAMPLLLFTIISSTKSNEIIGFLGRHKSKINRTAGVIMLGISMYYLIKVFNLFGTWDLLVRMHNQFF